MRPPEDIDQLLSRLREVAAEHADADLPEAGPAQPWMATSAAATSRPNGPAPDALQSQLLRHSGHQAPLSVYCMLDADHFVTLAYQNILGRQADPQGREHLLGKITRHTPRTELLLELALSDEAQRLQPGAWKQGRWLGRLLRLALNAPIARSRMQWLVRGVMRRTERWLAKRAQTSPFGLVWGQARTQDATLQQVTAHYTAQIQAQDAALQQLQTQAGTDRQALEAALKALEQLQIDLNTVLPSASTVATIERYFVAFDQRFRGDEATLSAQLSQDYLHLLHAARTNAGDKPCLDLGCGRGTWLELLRSEGFLASGVDLNAGAIVQAQARGLQARQGDALEWLRSQPGNSALAITAFHLMEHLPFAVRLAVTQEAARVLAPGGVLIYETPNPENIWVGTHTFYHDPTHTQPLTPASLSFLVEYSGLQPAPVVRLHPYPQEAEIPGDDPIIQRVNGMTCAAQDFAIVAHKPATLATAVQPTDAQDR